MTALPTLPRLLAALLHLVLLMSIGVGAHADEVSDVLALHRSGQTAAALTRADRFLTTKPKDPQMRFAKGVMLADTRRTAEAIGVFTALTQDYPELAEPYNNLAALYAGSGQYEQARVALEQALRANPTYATARENLGDVYAALAQASYARALELDPSNTTLPTKMALVRKLYAPAGGASAPSGAQPISP